MLLHDNSAPAPVRIQATRRFQFCAGHRVHKHESKCNNMHGHNYVLIVYAEAPELDSLGRVMDFSEIKAKILPWIDSAIDHGFIFKAGDVEVENALKSMPKQKMYMLKNNPTAENIGEHFLNDVFPVLFADTGITITKLVLWETENCFVEVSLKK